MGKMVRFDPAFYNGKKVLITGDSGFKGSWLSLLLWHYGADVVGYSLPPRTPEDHYHAIGLDQKIDHVDGDLADMGLLKATFDYHKPEIVFHLAAQPLVRLSYEEPSNTFLTNVQGSINVFECVRLCSSVKSFICVTSDKCYKNKEWIWGYRETDELGGHDPYSASKAALEVVFESYRLSFFDKIPGLGVSSVRAGNVIGGGDWSLDRIIPDCVKAIQSGEPILIRSPEATRPWQHVLEPLSGYIRLAQFMYEDPKGYSGAWNFGPNNTSHKSVLEMVKEVVDCWGTGEIRIEKNENNPHEAGFLHLNCDKANNYLDWNPVWNFKQTIKETVDWYRAVGKEDFSIKQITNFFNGVK